MSQGREANQRAKRRELSDRERKQVQNHSAARLAALPPSTAGRGEGGAGTEERRSRAGSSDGCCTCPAG